MKHLNHIKDLMKISKSLRNKKIFFLYSLNCRYDTVVVGGIKLTPLEDFGVESSAVELRDTLDYAVSRLGFSMLDYYICDKGLVFQAEGENESRVVPLDMLEKVVSDNVVQCAK